MKIRPLQDRILVKRIEEEEKTKGGIIIPDTAKEKPQEGKVDRRRQGQGRARTARCTPLDVKTGDRDPVRQVLRHRGQDRRRRAPDHPRGRHPRRSSSSRGGAQHMAAKEIRFDQDARAKHARAASTRSPTR